MAKLTGCAQSIPKSRQELWEWVRFFEAAVETTFSQDSPLLPYLVRMRQAINSGINFRGHKAADWQAYFWKYHVAVRAFFRNHGSWTDNLQPFNDLLFRLRQGVPCMPQEIPPEMRPRALHEPDDNFYGS